MIRPAEILQYFPAGDIEATGPRQQGRVIVL
ncbi:hypothetical protein ECTPHS_09013 [Ectothiorhodospira sp. PHS-1]|nr:hypothetical protein ECTPHS_09013 [Ectothiorhodospira sp. PHS-1]